MSLAACVLCPVMCSCLCCYCSHSQSQGGTLTPQWCVYMSCCDMPHVPVWLQAASVSMMSAKDARVSLMGELLRHLPIVKALGWEEALGNKVCPFHMDIFNLGILGRVVLVA